jgi:hypothetical protein
MNTTQSHPSVPQTQTQNPLWNLAVNVILPSIILTKLSDPARLGPTMAFWAALAFPLSAGIAELLKSRKISFFSGFGLLNVLLTGGLGFLTADGFWFAVKEAAVPSALGIAVLASAKIKMPLIQSLLLNENLINVALIRERLNQNGRQSEYDKLVYRSTILFSFSFFLSAVLNFGLARYILKSPTGTPEFNAELGRMTALSFPVIAVPVLIFTGLIFWYMFTGISKITNLSRQEIMLSQGQ